MTQHIQHCYEYYHELLENIKCYSDNLTIEDFQNIFKKCDKNGFSMSDIVKFDITDKCFLISNKRPEYYIHEYNPSEWFDCLIATQSNYEELKSIFDIEPRCGCCNCISFVLYLNNSHILFKRESYLSKSLECIQKSINNITIKLPEFIVRLYLDSSVFEYFNEYIEYIKRCEGELKIRALNVLNDKFKKIRSIINAQNVEIYIYFCDKIKNQIEPIERIRTYRFLPLFDNDVNVCISREVDGIVSFVDCHNIKLFSSNNHHSIAIITESYGSFRIKNKIKIVGEELIIKNSENRKHYQKWLNSYDELEFKPGNRNNITLIDILAGNYGIKIKYTEDYINGTVQKINKNLEAIKKKINDYKDKIDKKLEIKTDIIHNLLNNWNILDSKPSPEYLLYFINVGYDEIFLLELFSPILTLFFDPGKVYEPIDSRNYYYRYYDRFLETDYLRPLMINKLQLLTLIEDDNIKPFTSKELEIYKQNILDKFINPDGLDLALHPIILTEMLFKNYELKPEYLNSFFNYNSIIINHYEALVDHIDKLDKLYKHKYLKYKLKYINLIKNKNN